MSNEGNVGGPVGTTVIRWAPLPSCSESASAASGCVLLSQVGSVLIWLESWSNEIRIKGLIPLQAIGFNLVHDPRRTL